MDYSRRRGSNCAGGAIVGINGTSGMINNSNTNGEQTTPICRCRVLYLGSAVPHLSKDGLQGVQEPLRELYPECGVPGVGSIGPNGTMLPINNGNTSASGIDSWISVWSNGILVENVDDYGREIRRFFPIESLHYCAAVRYVNLPDEMNNNHNASNANNLTNSSKFLPLDSPFLRHAKSDHPPLFACILRRTTGIKVLECHAFVCKREAAANALVRCCFHAYADNMYVKQIDENPYSQIEGGADGPKNDSVDCLDGDASRSTRSSIRTNCNMKCSNGDKSACNNHNDINSDTELATSNCSSTDNRSPQDVDEEEDDDDDVDHDDHDDERQARRLAAELNGGRRSVDPQLLGGYKLWSGSKSLSGSVKDLNMLSSMNGCKLSKGLSIRSLRPARHMPTPNLIATTPGPYGPQLIQSPMYAHPLAYQAFANATGAAIPHMPPQSLDKLDKASLKLWKKLKSKSMANLIANPTPIAQPPFMFMPPLPPHFQAHSPQQPFGPLTIAGPPGPPAPVPITGNIHTIKKKSKKNKELQKLQAQQQQWLIQQQQQQQQLFLQSGHQAAFITPEMANVGQPMYMPPMRSLTPMHPGYPMSNEQCHSNTLVNNLTSPRRKSSGNLEQMSQHQQQQLHLHHQQQHQHQQQQQQHHHQQQQHVSSNNVDDESLFNSGIYRRKGHLNERAFSYSIRQEQRSRSGSLANLMTGDQTDGYFEPSPDNIMINDGNMIAGQVMINANDSNRLTAALQQLQLDGAAPKTASIKRSQLNSVNALRPSSSSVLGLTQSHLGNSSNSAGVSKFRHVQPPAPPNLDAIKKSDMKKKSKK